MEFNLLRYNKCGILYTRLFGKNQVSKALDDSKAFVQEEQSAFLYDRTTSV